MTTLVRIALALFGIFLFIFATVFLFTGSVYLAWETTISNSPKIAAYGVAVLVCLFAFLLVVVALASEFWAHK